MVALSLFCTLDPYYGRRDEESRLGSVCLCKKKEFHNRFRTEESPFTPSVYSNRRPSPSFRWKTCSKTLLRHGSVSRFLPTEVSRYPSSYVFSLSLLYRITGRLTPFFSWRFQGWVSSSVGFRVLLPTLSKNQRDQSSLRHRRVSGPKSKIGPVCRWSTH